jgi:hypothetical protein
VRLDNEFLRKQFPLLPSTSNLPHYSGRLGRKWFSLHSPSPLNALNLETMKSYFGLGAFLLCAVRANTLRDDILAHSLDSGVLQESMNASLLSDCGISKEKGFAPNSKLPNPFVFLDGRKVGSKADWACRREEIKILLQEYELGFKPPKPQVVSGKMVGNSLQITATEGGKTLSFSANINYPKNGGEGPFALLVGLGMLSVPAHPNVATMNFNIDAIAQQNGGGSRNRGKFFEFYGSNGAGALIAWAWGFSRIIDTIETTPESKINPKKIAVTGCSRNGKAALTIGAFDDRIALTLPQESGTGGTACWRVADKENNGKGSNGGTQTAGQIVGENVWFSTNFTQKAKNVNALPYDHHMLIGLVAPRPMLSIDNSEPKWLGPVASWTCLNAAQTIFESLGAKDKLGVSVAPSHPHCSFPQSQAPELQAFVERHLLDKQSPANVFKASGQVYSKSQWVDWEPVKLN